MLDRRPGTWRWLRSCAAKRAVHLALDRLWRQVLCAASAVRAVNRTVLCGERLQLTAALFLLVMEARRFAERWLGGAAC